MPVERTALSKKPEDLIKRELSALKKTDKLTPDLVFRDPCFLDFLGLKGAYQEKDLESAILREMESFILEMGTGFAFLERQKRITLDGEDFYLDLLFYHRGLNRTRPSDWHVNDWRKIKRRFMFSFKADLSWPSTSLRCEAIRGNPIARYEFR